MVIDVVAALLEKDGKYLIARRNYGNETSVNKFEFPGGKVEKGEDILHAIERELDEEMSIRVKGIKEVMNYVHEIPDRTINLRLILCEYISGDIILKNHSEYAFVDGSNILNYPLCPGDKHIAEELINKNII